MNQIHFFATKVEHLARPDVKPAKTDTTEFDKAWVDAYVADRRRRGVDPLGVLMEGETGFVTAPASLQQLQDAPSIQVCKRGHLMTPENVCTFTTSYGYLTTTCRECRRVRAQAYYQANREKWVKPPRQCKYGHEYSAENSYMVPDVHGKEVRRCVTCRDIKEQSLAETGLVPRVNVQCSKGHDVVGENALVTKQGYSLCRTCQRENKRRYYHKNRRGVSA